MLPISTVLASREVPQSRNLLVGLNTFFLLVGKETAIHRNFSFVSGINLNYLFGSFRGLNRLRAQYLHVPTSEHSLVAGVSRESCLAVTQRSLFPMLIEHFEYLPHVGEK
jgi:hypothetical protein